MFTNFFRVPFTIAPSQLNSIFKAFFQLLRRRILIHQWSQLVFGMVFDCDWRSTRLHSFDNHFRYAIPNHFGEETGVLLTGCHRIGACIWLLLLYGLVRRAVARSITAEPLSREFLTPVAVVGICFYYIKGVER